ncbi:hypothetical protein COV20_05700 [Candidatus Woesearchaeota archaeon CG10_big_fil_rev_8_21_14_0_10_45_16]|nr:MAG: hypothetical protein COV20_05700 [Candidatus Woesearchaeota archaeon CG10_big_fil_rev_8_21_14_0_10_45_16]
MVIYGKKQHHMPRYQPIRSPLPRIGPAGRMVNLERIVGAENVDHHRRAWMNQQDYVRLAINAQRNLPRVPTAVLLSLLYR